MCVPINVGTDVLEIGDCLTVLKSKPCDTFDALVTDPPAGISFMNKSWDHHKGGRDEWVTWLTEVMKECLRVLKPGAHGLVWAIPRTSYWTGTALENAGFEVRDVITHLFGSGFPKSLDISKAIDKAAGAERKVVGKMKNPASTNRVNTMGRPEHSGSGWNQSPDVTTPTTPEAKQWEGFGTALKPAAEFWFLVRKPLSEKTVAKNVLKWGTGGLNIDACRIGTGDSLNGGAYAKEGNRTVSQSLAQGGGMNQPGKTTGKEFSQPQGRFPANLVLSCSIHCTEDQHDIECAAAMLDKQSGESKSAGGASRFFYVAKPSKRERNEGLTEWLNTHPTVKPIKLMRYLIRLITPPGGHVLDPFMGSGTTGCAAKIEGFGFCGIEAEPDYFKIAQGRIQQFL